MEQCMNSKRALLVIDIQEDYTGTTAKAPFPYKDSDKLICDVNSIIDEASKNGIIVVYIRHEFEGLMGRLVSRVIGHGTAIKGKPGTEIDKRINIISDNLFTKPAPDAFANPKLDKFLKENEVNELYLVGLDAAGCVYYTAKGAMKHGYKVNIIKDSIALLVEKYWDTILSKYNKQGINLITSKEF